MVVGRVTDNSSTLIQGVQRLLESKFTDKSAFQLEPLRSPLLSLRCKLWEELLNARNKYRHPKDKEFTDLDRKIMLDANVAELEARYQLVKGIEDLVKERIDLIKGMVNDSN